MLNKLKIALFIYFSVLNITFSQNNPTGTIEGFVFDSFTKEPLIGTNITIINTSFGAASDVNGKFRIEKIPVGNYSVKFQYIGYSSTIKTDVIIRSQRTTQLSVELAASTIESDEVTVSAGYFSQNDVQPLSITTFSSEEIRRSPGSGGDVSRILMSLPSLAKVNDQTNSLIVRGGSPLENSFYLDGIEIPNINHFPSQGASGGPIGMINVDLINEVNFFTGGFSTMYGDKLSSVLELKFREGNRTFYNNQIDLNIMGFGLVSEGPLSSNSSFLFSARRSYLNYVSKLFDIGTTSIPNYGDIQAKITWDINSKHKISLIALHGDDHNYPDRQAGIDNDMIFYGNQDIYQTSTGISWRALWNNSAYSQTSIGFLSSNYKEDFFETNTAQLFLRNRSLESSVNFRNSNHLRLSNSHSLELGFDYKHLINDYDNLYNSFSDALGNSTNTLVVDKTVHSDKAGAFINYITEVFTGFKTTVGIRSDYFSFSKNFTFSPRASFSYQFDELNSIKFAAGLFHQNLPMIILTQNNQNNELKDPYAVHYILGYEHLLSEDTKFSIEFYQKLYNNFPVDPSNPSLFVIDEIFYRNGSYFGHEKLTDNGKAKSYGTEITLQKKLSDKLYGLVSLALFKTEYKSDDKWRDRVFDNRLIISAEAGYKLNSEWEFSAKWIYAGGTPFTPFDIEKSRTQKRGVFDESKINSERYPAYHSLNIRVDKRFHFNSTNLILYLSVWNAYDRRNVAGYFWNENKNSQSTLYQWNLLPIFGLEYEL